MNVFGILFALIPVLLFLAGLFFLDSYKLVSINKTFQCLLAGMISAVLAYFINTYLMKNVFTDPVLYSRYGAPIIEESIKLIFPVWLAFRKKIGFMVDGAIMGFATGAGFSLIENVFFLFSLAGNTNLLLWAIRGLGTAVMHGGTIAIAMIILMSDFSKRSANRLLGAGLAALFIHSLFNHFPVSPLVMTVLQIIILPVLALTVFEISEKGLKSWLDTGFVAASLSG
jgi:RsiW-degrading membrane proteinase PrsW (M82 family)